MPIKMRNYFLMAFCGQYPANHFTNPLARCCAVDDDDTDTNTDIKVDLKGEGGMRANVCPSTITRLVLWGSAVSTRCKHSHYEHDERMSNYEAPQAREGEGAAVCTAKGRQGVAISIAQGPNRIRMTWLVKVRRPSVSQVTHLAHLAKLQAIAA